MEFLRTYFKTAKKIDSVYIGVTFKSGDDFKNRSKATRFERCKFNRVIWQEVTKETNWYENCTFIGCAFIDVNLSDIYFKNCKFTDCTFSGANVSEVTLISCTFFRCSFVDTLFKRGRLYTATFWSCDTKDLVFDGCIIEAIKMVDISFIPHLYRRFSKEAINFFQCCISVPLFERVPIYIDEAYFPAEAVCGIHL